MHEDGQCQPSFSNNGEEGWVEELNLPDRGLDGTGIRSLLTSPSTSP